MRIGCHEDGNEIRTPIDGVVKEVYVNETDKVSVGDKMLVVE